MAQYLFLGLKMYKTPKTAIKHLIAGASFDKKVFDEMRDNQIVALCAIKLNPSNFDLISERLKSDPEVLAASGRKLAPVKKEPEVLVQVETIKPVQEAPKPAIPEVPKPTESIQATPVQQEIKLEQPKVVVSKPTTTYPYAPEPTPKRDSAFVAFVKKLFKGS